jgi:hypothetical protein
LTEPRERLATAQRELLAALVAGGAPPGGFDRERLGIQADSLIAKRRGLVARAAPDLVTALGAEFRPLFAAYAAGRPKPPGGSRGDARAFAEWLPPSSGTGEPVSSSPAVPLSAASRFRRFLSRGRETSRARRAST